MKVFCIMEKINDSGEYKHFKYKEQDVACSYTKEIKELY